MGPGDSILISTVTCPEVLPFIEAFSFSPPDAVTSVFSAGQGERPNTCGSAHFPNLVK